MRMMRVLALIAAVMMLLGCDSSDDGTGAPDTAQDTLPPEDSGQQPSCQPLEQPYGTELGEVIEPFELTDCDGNKVTFEDLWCNKKALLIDIGAAWCEPCIEESETLEAELYQPYKNQGLEIAVVLFETEDKKPATTQLCKEWRSQFGLSMPVLIDPIFSTKKYFGDVSSGTPVNMLVDSKGVIRYKVSGVVPTDISGEIEKLLAE